MWILRPPVRAAYILGDTYYSLWFFHGPRRCEFFGRGHQSFQRNLHSIQTGFDGTVEDELFQFLIANELVENPDQPTIEQFITSPFSRQISYYSTQTDLVTAAMTHKQISLARAMIVGVGGLGTHILEHLVRIGVSNFIIVDHDRVEVSNLNRQILFKESDVGRPKTEAAQQRLREIRSSIRIDSYDSLEQLLSSGGTQGVTVAFISADEDQYRAKKILVPILYKNRTSYIFCSYSGGQLIIDPAVFRHDAECGSCVETLTILDNDLRIIPRPTAVPASSFASNAICASIAVDLWCRSISSTEVSNVRVTGQMGSFSLNTSPLRRISSCPICGHEDEK